MQKNDRSGIGLTSRLSSRNVSPGKVRHILIFDDHPESLRLVFDRAVDLRFHFFDRERMISWATVLVWGIVVALMMAMLWPLL
jgi:hypothetical protein